VAADERWSLEHGMIVRRFGSGPELVWIHGLGEWSVSFDPVAHHPALATFTHVLPDLPGYGRSPRADASSGTLEQTADHLAAWLRERPPAVLLGHSLGGMLVIMLAERGVARAIIDVDGNLSAGDCTFSTRARKYSEAEFVAHGFAAVRAEMFENGASDPAMRGYFAAASAASPITFHRHALDLLALSESEVLAARLAAVHCPALFIAAVPGGVCEHTRSLLDHHKIPWLPIQPSGHWPFIDQPDAFATAVADFLHTLS